MLFWEGWLCFLGGRDAEGELYWCQSAATLGGIVGLLEGLLTGKLLSVNVIEDDDGVYRSSPRDWRLS